MQACGLIGISCGRWSCWCLWSILPVPQVACLPHLRSIFDEQSMKLMYLIAVALSEGRLLHQSMHHIGLTSMQLFPTCSL